MGRPILRSGRVRDALPLDRDRSGSPPEGPESLQGIREESGGTPGGPAGWEALLKVQEAFR